MKTDLGTRPIYHQESERTKSHLFISILAYHILANIEYRLRQQSKPSRWSTICKQLINHTRCHIIQWKDENGKSQKKNLAGNQNRNISIPNLHGILQLLTFMASVVIGGTSIIKDCNLEEQKPRRSLGYKQIYETV